MTCTERHSLAALGLSLALAVALNAAPAAAAGGDAVQVFPQAGGGAAYGDEGLAFPGARTPQSRLLVPAPPDVRPLAEPTPAPTPRRVETAKPQAPKPAPVPVAQPAPEPAPAPAPAPAPEPVQAQDSPEEEPPLLGPDVAPQDDVVARERLSPDAPPEATGEMPPPVVPTDVAPPEPKVEAAAVPPSIDMLTVPFPPDLSEPATDVSAQIADLVGLLDANPDARLRLNAYAPGTTAEESRTRRLSLARALALRSKLVDAGVSSTRIEVRALGNKVPDGSADRVDVIVLER